MEVINPTAEDLVRGCILQDVAVSSSKKMATWKLNSSGIMTGHCAVINSEESMSRYRDELQRMATIESFKSSEEKRAQSKKKEKEDAMRSRAPKAAKKVLSMEGSMESRLSSCAITKEDIAAILWKAYNISMDPSKQKNKKDKYLAINMSWTRQNLMNVPMLADDRPY